jgi:hypothetical protein
VQRSYVEEECCQYETQVLSSVLAATRREENDDNQILIVLIREERYSNHNDNYSNLNNCNRLLCRGGMNLLGFLFR